MLEGLDQVNWSRLGHAYGEASDVPGLLRDLASQEKEDREHAVYELCGNIVHQGTVYEATAFAVPFLIELLRSADVLDKHEILILMAQIACGTSYHDVHQHLLLHRDKAKTERWQVRIREEMVWLQNAKAAVQSGEPLYLDFLSHPDSSVREASAYLLACLPQRSASVAEKIWERFLAESTDSVKVSLVLSFGTFTATSDTNRLAELFVSASDKSIRLAAALSLVSLSPAEASQDVIEFLVMALGRRDEYPAFSKAPWLIIDDFDSCIMKCLGTLTGDDAKIMERELGVGLASEDPGHLLACVETLLTLAFKGSIARSTGFTLLTDRQKRIIGLLVEHPGIWDQIIGANRMPNVQTSILMRSCGLPDNFSEFMEFASGRIKQSSPIPPPKRKVGLVEQIKTLFRPRG